MKNVLECAKMGMLADTITHYEEKATEETEILRYAQDRHG
jgi:hypothetical protein